MHLIKRSAALGLLFLLSWLLPYGCSSQERALSSQTTDTADSTIVAERLRAVATSGILADLRWPDFSDYHQLVEKLYEEANYAPVWLHDGQPTTQALQIIAALQNSQQKGLNPDDYEAPRWQARLNALKAARANADTNARFDAALTVSAMRYISDLHIGRVNPRHFQFDMDIESKKYDLPHFLSQKILAANDMQAALNEVEPQYNAYKRTEAALEHYLTLAVQDNGTPLPGIQKTLAAGDAYAGVDQLARRLRLLGDLPQDATVNTSGMYDTTLAEAVKRFQHRHGLSTDGKLNKETLRQLNTPLSTRVVQLEDALERWRWLPPNFSPLPVAVNIPEFVLRAFAPDRHVALRMNVVVGKAVRHQTPVFAQKMKVIVFRPYWNVPLSIVRAEIIPALQKDKTYLERKNFEITDQSGRVITDSTVTSEMLIEIRSGKLLVRQRPGPENSLGLVKFLFPNTYNVYLHSTPAQQLFAQSRRDFSHGCIRVEKPVDLAAWLLQDQPQWTRDKIETTMQSGPDNQQVQLTKPVPVVIVYLTAVVEEDGEVRFFDDIYGHDRSLNEVLAKGRPYPE